MDDDLRYRTELADQFLARLRDIAAEQWYELLSQHRGDDRYYTLALELADEATRLLGDDRRAAYESALQVRTRHANEIVAGRALDAVAAPVATQLAHGAVHALFMRDAYGFNSGAYGELVRPFRPYLDLGEVERLANRVRTPPGGASPVPPPGDAPSAPDANAPSR